MTPLDHRRHIGLFVSALFGMLLVLAAVLPASASATPRPLAAARKAAIGCPPLPGRRTTMLDASFAPPSDSLVTLRRGGARGFGGYLQSPDAYNVWSRADFARVRAAGFMVVPIFVGPASGSTAARGAGDAANTIRAARAAGFLFGPVVLDVEPYALNDDPAGVAGYTRTWAAAMRGAGYSPLGYGLASYFRTLTVAGDAGSIDVAWVARYDVAPAHPDAHSAPGMPHEWMTDGSRVWQYQGSTDVAGASVDLSVADSAVARYLRPGNC